MYVHLVLYQYTVHNIMNVRDDLFLCAHFSVCMISSLCIPMYIQIPMVMVLFTYVFCSLTVHVPTVCIHMYMCTKSSVLFSSRLNISPSPKKRRPPPATTDSPGSSSKRPKHHIEKQTVNSANISSTATDYIHITDVDLNGAYIKLRNTSDQVCVCICPQVEHTPYACAYLRTYLPTCVEYTPC